MDGDDGRSATHLRSAVLKAAAGELEDSGNGTAGGKKLEDCLEPLKTVYQSVQRVRKHDYRQEADGVLALLQELEATYKLKRR